VDAGFEPDQLGAPLQQQVLAEAVAPVHLEREAAEIAQLLLAEPEERTPFAPQVAGGRRRSPARRRRPSSQESSQGRKAHHVRESTGRFGELFEPIGAGLVGADGTCSRSPACADEEDHQEDDPGEGCDEHHGKEDPEHDAEDDQDEGGGDHGPLLPGRSRPETRTR
jgi:hypothetical protein